MPTGLERITAGVYADRLIDAGTHQRDAAGNAVRRLEYPAKVFRVSLEGVKKGKRKKRRAVGMA